MKLTRRQFMAKATLATLGSIGILKHGYGSSQKIRLGFIALTDCAPLVIAHELGFFKRYGVEVELYKEASWATTRDHLLSGEIAGAHTLFGLPFSVYTGIGGPAGKVIKIALILNNNGQSITLSNKVFGSKVRFRDTEGVGKVVLDAKRSGKPLTFAMTFPGGTHDMWLRYFLGACGVDPTEDVKLIVIPPPQMVANMSVENMDGFCVGEPWNEVAVRQNVGFTVVSSQDIWKHHPEKVLAFNEQFFNTYNDKARAIMMAVLQAQMWLDDMNNRGKTAQIIGRRQYVNADPKVIEDRLKGVYNLGNSLGNYIYKDDYMLFYRGGQTPFPRKSYGVWFLAQYRRFGMLKSPPNYQNVVNTIIAQDIYVSVAREMKVPIPKDDMKPIKGFIDKVIFDPMYPEGSIKSYRVKKV